MIGEPYQPSNGQSISSAAKTDSIDKKTSRRERGEMRREASLKLKDERQVTIP